MPPKGKAKATGKAGDIKKPTKVQTTASTKKNATAKKAVKPAIVHSIETDEENDGFLSEDSSEEYEEVRESDLDVRTGRKMAKKLKSTKPPTNEFLSEESSEEHEEERESDKDVPTGRKAAKKSKSTKPPTKKAPAKKSTSKRKKAADDDDEDSGPKKKKTKKAKDDEQSEADSDGSRTKSHKPAKKRPAAPLDLATNLRVPTRKQKTRHNLNPVPEKKLQIFVFGEGSSGELGLGSMRYDGKKPIDVKRPRLNHNLEGRRVVQVACGGMHAIALTADRKILTWGVNDDKALGRDTTWDGGLKAEEDDSDSDDDDDDDTGLNPHESTPGEVDLRFHEDIDEAIKISQVAATDSASFFLTDSGDVYGWGTFRGPDGIIGFSDTARVQENPVKIDELENITKLACGSNHVLALDSRGRVFTWGSGGQYQLGRKPLARKGGATAGLRPQACGRFTRNHFATDIAAGSYHSFYLDNRGEVWSWGLNNYSQTGHYDDTGNDDAMVLQPRLVRNLRAFKVSMLAGGEHHTVACTDDGQLLTWGRVDGHQVGQPNGIYTHYNAVFDDNDRPRILLEPTIIEGVSDVVQVAAGVDTSFAVTKDGQAYSWGFSANYQTGQGTTNDVEVPTLIENTAIRGKSIVWAGAGGQYAALAAQTAAPPRRAKTKINSLPAPAAPVAPAPVPPAPVALAQAPAPAPAPDPMDF